MCTVTFIPQGEKGFILTSNRDESPKRAAKEMATKKIEGGVEVHFPKDAKAGGTWIAASNDHRLVCVLNGAFKKHKHEPPYRLSRGIMALEFFEYDSAIDFFENFEFEGMEPFTFIVVDRGNLFDFRWDGIKSYLHPLDNQGAYIWSSSTLYPPEMQEKRKTVFLGWMEEQSDISKDIILDLHLNGKVGDPENDFAMNRQDLVRTVSITSVSYQDGAFAMEFRDLVG